MKAIVLAAGYTTDMYPLTQNQPKALLPLGGKFLIDHAVEQISESPEINEIIVVSNQKFIDQFEEWAMFTDSATPITILNDGSIIEDDCLGNIGDIYFAIYSRKITEDILVIDECLAEKCLFRADILPLFDQYMYEGRNLYELGNFLQWLQEKGISIHITKAEGINTIDDYEALRDSLGEMDESAGYDEYFKIFFTFVKIGSLTFGAGYNMLPLLYKEISVKRKWVTKEEITDYFVISQCVPGLTVVKTSALLGYRYKKGLGALFAGLGIAFPVLSASLLIAVFFDQLIEFAWVRHLFNGLQVAVLALVIEAVIQMWKTGIKKDVYCIIIFFVSVLLFAVFNISPVLAVIAGGICGLIIKQFVRENVKEKRKTA